MQKPERCATHSSLFLPLAAVAVRAPGRTKSDQRGIPLAVYRQHPTKEYHNRQSMARASVQMDGGSFCCGFPFRLACRLPSPSQSAYASCATSPTGRGKCTPVGGGQAVVRQTCSRLRLTTLFAGIDGGTLGSPRGGTNSDRVQWTKQGAVSGAALRFLQAGTAPRRKKRLSARGAGAKRLRGEHRQPPGKPNRRGLQSLQFLQNEHPL